MEISHMLNILLSCTPLSFDSSDFKIDISLSCDLIDSKEHKFSFWLMKINNLLQK